MDVNNLVHIPEFGDFQLESIVSEMPPYQRSHKGSQEMAEQSRILAQPDESKQETLDQENTPDPFASEQTWPTEDELREAKRLRVSGYVF